MQQEMYDLMVLAEGLVSGDVSDMMKEAIWRDVHVTAMVAKRRQRHRDAVWGGALAAVVTFGIAGLAWYTPTQTVTVTEIEVRKAPDVACNDALDKAGELFNIISQVMIKSGERDTADDAAVTALRDKNWDEFQSAAGEAFAINDQMIVLVDQAKGVDLGSAEACNG